MGVPRIFQTNLVQTGLECDDFNIFIKIFAFAYSENLQKYPLLRTIIETYSL